MLRKQIASSNRPSVSLSLNIPGYPKSNETVKRFFDLCLKDLRLFLKANLANVSPENEIIRIDSAGDFFLVPMEDEAFNALQLKQLGEGFEEDHPLGRFIDVDVVDKTGSPVSSGKAKLCFYCGQKPANVCRWEGAHDQQELREFMFSRMRDYYTIRREKDIIRHVSALALKAMLHEISLTPKPGLVDKSSNGSHADMNYQTFLNSSAVLSSWFGELVKEGLRFKNKDFTKALPVIRKIGLQMEEDMFKATNQVNTQKGLIFLLGLSLFTAGYLFKTKNTFNPEGFREVIKEICKNITGRELGLPRLRTATHGEEVYQKYGISGARGEAEGGFPTVFNYGLPILVKSPNVNDQTLMETFLSIAAHNNDTNILYRGNAEVLEKFKAMALKTIHHYTLENYLQLIDYCKKENISPGGSADLLVVSIFIYYLRKSVNPMDYS